MEMVALVAFRAAGKMKLILQINKVNHLFMVFFWQGEIAAAYR